MPQERVDCHLYAEQGEINCFDTGKCKARKKIALLAVGFLIYLMCMLPCFPPTTIHRCRGIR